MKRKLGKKVYNFLVLVDRSQATVLIFAEIVGGVVLSVFFSILFLKLQRDVIRGSLFDVDFTVSNFIFSLRSPILTKIMFFLTFLGGKFIEYMVFLVFSFLIIKKQRKEAIFFLVLIAMGAFINFSLKMLVERPRPDFSPMFTESTYSFPSGHAMNSFVFYILLVFLFFRFTRNKKLTYFFSLIALFLVCLIGISRIYLGVHYPSDVLAGFLAGFWWFVTAILIEKTLEFPEMFKKIPNGA